MNLIQHTSLPALVDQHFDAVCPKLAKAKKIKGKIIEYRAASVKGKIEKMLHKYRKRNALPLFEYLNTNFEGILKDDVWRLARHVRNIKTILTKNRLSLYKNDLFNDVAKCFDYEGYKVKGTPYKILAQLSVNACPYCNRQFINTFTSPKGKTRATLDHFFAQSKYPYLAISFYNLVPACYSCNLNIKRDKNFSLSTHLHPFHTSFEKIARFTISYKKVGDIQKYIAEFYADPAFMEIGFEPVYKSTSPDYKRAERNIEDLCLRGLYNLHKDFVIELLQKNVVFNTAGYAASLLKSYPKIFRSEDEILKMVLGNYIQASDFNKRPFSRLTRDIANELGFIKLLTT